MNGMSPYSEAGVTKACDSAVPGGYIKWNIRIIAGKSERSDPKTQISSSYSFLLACPEKVVCHLHLKKGSAVCSLFRSNKQRIPHFMASRQGRRLKGTS